MSQDSISTLPAAVLKQLHVLVSASPDPVSAFIYDLGALQAHARWLRSCLPRGVELYYAIKANSEPRILKALASCADGFEVSSGGEIERVAACVSHKRFVFSGPGKLDSDLECALAHGVEMVHVESLEEIQRLSAVAARCKRRQPVLIRINPVLPEHLATRVSMAGVPTPFGIEESQLPDAVQKVERSDSLLLSGFHIHAMSHQVHTGRHQKLLEWYVEKWPVWKSLARNPQTIGYLNAGGGMGVSYVGAEQFDWSALCGHLGRRLRECADAPLVRFEPGRFIAAFCGYYAMQVLDIKRNHGERFAVCRGGTHQFRLPAAQAHDHPVIHVPIGRENQDSASNATPITVVGQLCTPKDVLARNVMLRDLRIGDLLVLPLAGAYGYNISHADFLCHPRPAQIFLDTDSVNARDQWSDPHAANACR